MIIKQNLHFKFSFVRIPHEYDLFNVNDTETNAIINGSTVCIQIFTQNNTAKTCITTLYFLSNT